MKLKSKSLPIGQCHMPNAWQGTTGNSAIVPLLIQMYLWVLVMKGYSRGNVNGLAFFLYFFYTCPSSPSSSLVGDDFSEFDVDGSSAYSDWQESLALATSNKTLSQLLKPWSSWNRLIPVAVHCVRAACLQKLTHLTVDSVILELWLVWLFG